MHFCAHIPAEQTSFRCLSVQLLFTNVTFYEYMQIYNTDLSILVLFNVEIGYAAHLLHTVC